MALFGSKAADAVAPRGMQPVAAPNAAPGFADLAKNLPNTFPGMGDPRATAQDLAADPRAKLFGDIAAETKDDAKLQAMLKQLGLDKPDAKTVKQFKKTTDRGEVEKLARNLVPGLAAAGGAAAAAVNNQNQSATGTAQTPEQILSPLKPDHPFASVKIDISPNHNAEQVAHIEAELNKAPTKIGPDIQLTNDGSYSLVKVEEPATIKLAPSVYGGIDLSTVSIQRFGEYLRVRVSKQAQDPMAPADTMLVPLANARHVKLAYEVYDPVTRMPSKTNFVSLSELNIEGNPLEARTARDIMTAKLQLPSLEDRLLSMDVQATKTGISPEKMEENLSRILTNADEKPAVIGSATKDAQLLSEIPVLGLEQIRNGSYNLELKTPDKTKLAEFTAKLTGTYADATKTTLNAAAPHLLLKVKATESAFIAPTYRVLKDVSIKLENKDGTTREVAIKAGAVLSRSQYAMIKTLATEHSKIAGLEAKSVKIEPDFTKATERIQTVFLSDKNQQGGMVHLALSTQVSVVNDAQSGLFTSDKSSPGLNLQVQPVSRGGPNTLGFDKHDLPATNYNAAQLQFMLDSLGTSHDVKQTIGQGFKYGAGTQASSTEKGWFAKMFSKSGVNN